MKKITAVFLTILFILALGCESWAISWERDLAGALKRSKDEGKPVMADFYTDWCGWCKKLDKDVYSDPGVNSLAEKFICVKVNCEADKNAFSKYGLKGYPTIIFFDPSGGIAETVVGYRPAPVFIGIMNTVLDKSPKTAAPERPKADPPVVKPGRAEGEFALSGIMGQKAIVNGKVVVEGDEVDGAKVLKVTPGGVKLRYNDKELTLNI